MNLDGFLMPFFPDANEPIHFRAFRPKNAPKTAENEPRMLTLTRRKLAAPRGDIELRSLNHLRGVYFSVNAGGSTDDQITRFNAVFAENDSLSIDEQHTALDGCPLPTSIRVETKRSVHAYWLLKQSCSAEDWCDIQNRLIGYFDGDKSIKNPSRVMRVPTFWHLTYAPESTGKYDFKTVIVVQFDPAIRYSIDELQATFPRVYESVNGRAPCSEIGEVIENGNRNNVLFSVAGTLRNRGLGESEILASITAVNETRVRPPLTSQELVEIAKNVIRYSPGTQSAQSDPETGNQGRAESISIPQLLPKALFGLTGDLIRTIEPHTEADNAALLVQLLAGFGNLIGRTAYFRVEADLHYTKLNAVLVGASSKGRKGTSWGHVHRLLCRVDESFIECVHDGLSSGEGLIHHVRDAQKKKVPIKKQGRIVDYQEEIVDEGACEKRAFILEPEFARVLGSMKREGNTISSVIRQAWDWTGLAY
jgi:hypothetical protein